MRHKNNFEEIRLQISSLRDHLAGIQKDNEKGFSPDNYVNQKVLMTKLEDLWQKEAMVWHQRSRGNWLKMGDKNTHFFHLTIIRRRQRNQVAKLKDGNGIWQTEHTSSAEIIKGHFQNLYSSPPNRIVDDVISLVDPSVPDETNSALTKPVSREEVKMAAFQMGPLKAPGSDGFPGLFYQKYWHIVGEDVFPKGPNPESMSHFRPISLCRFNYKIISELMANRLQPFIDNIITEEQSAFIPGRQIHDNITVAHEVFHCLKRKKGAVAVKLDLNKAYDRIRWDFLMKVLEKMGFSPIWIWVGL